MNARILLLATLAGTMALYAWQTVSNTVLDMVLPWHSRTWQPFPSPDLAAQTTAVTAPRNGIFIAQEGIFTVVSRDPNVPDRSALMPVMLARQLAIDTAAVMLVVMLVLAVRVPRARDAAALTAFGAVAVSAVNYLSLSNWYGFPLLWSVVNIADQGIGWLLAGLAIGVVAVRRQRHEEPRPPVTAGDYPAPRRDAVTA
jgi:hypothetical protein